MINYCTDIGRWVYSSGTSPQITTNLLVKLHPRYQLRPALQRLTN